MRRAVRFRVLEKSETACVQIRTRTGLLERALKTSDLEEPVRNKESHCWLETSLVMIAVGVLCEMRLIGK